MLNYKAYIFDVDGTLYSKRKMQLKMGLKLISHALKKIGNITELKYIKLFREYREMAEYKDKSVGELVDIMSNIKHWNKEHVKSVIDFWMFEAPLEILRQSSYKNVISFINKEKSNGKIIAIYSDYPANDKLKAMGVGYNYVFTADDDEIKGQKPNENGMKYILAILDYPAEEILYVGDRDEKDGESAKMMGIHYMDIKKFKKACDNMLNN